MEKYLKDNVVLKINDKQFAAKLLYMNITGNVVSMNLECGSAKIPNAIAVKNLIMTATCTDQANMVIIRKKDFKEGVNLSSELTEHTFNIK